MFPESEKSWFVTRELCSLPGSQVFSLLVMMGQNLNLRNLIYKVRTVLIGDTAGQLHPQTPNPRQLGALYERV